MSTKIEWTNFLPGYKGESWNPIIGCSKISPGCDNCYAETAAASGRLQQFDRYKKVITNKKWNGNVAFHRDTLYKPLKWGKPRLIFVCSMGDLFHESISFERVVEVMNVIEMTPRHIYIVLTKRPERAKAFFDIYNNRSMKLGSIDDIKIEDPFKNLWLGTTTENQEQADKRIPILLEIPAAVRFVSIEPMLGSIDLTKIVLEKSNLPGIKPDIGIDSLKGWFGGFNEDDATKLDWVICGGESGPKARPMHPDWVRSLRDQCKDAGTPFFFKQWGEWLPFGEKMAGGVINLLSKGKQPQYWKEWGGEISVKIGKKKAGRLLDGVEHNEYPASTQWDNCYKWSERVENYKY